MERLDIPTHVKHGEKKKVRYSLNDRVYVLLNVLERWFPDGLVNRSGYGTGDVTNRIMEKVKLLGPKDMPWSRTSVLETIKVAERLGLIDTVRNDPQTNGSPGTLKGIGPFRPQQAVPEPVENQAVPKLPADVNDRLTKIEDMIAGLRESQLVIEKMMTTLLDELGVTFE